MRRARVLATALLVLLVASGCAVRAADPTPDPAATMPPSPSPSVQDSGAPIPTSDPGAATATPGPAASPSVQPVAEAVREPLVPVAGFWSTEGSIRRTSLVAAVAGAVTNPRPVFVAQGWLAPLLDALGLTAAGPNVTEVPLNRLRAQLRTTARSIGILPAADVTPAIRVLALDGRSLFGVDRVRDITTWPLLAVAPDARTVLAFDPAALWTMAAGGDVMLDRAIYRLSILSGRSASYPWSGGNARITGTYCCGAPGFRLVRTVSDGGGYAVRHLLSAADLAVVNLEGPAPDHFTYHPHGLVFSFDPRMLKGLTWAGIDAVSLANNHIRNAGGTGVVETVANLDALGIKHAGAGKTLIAARRPAWLTAGGKRIAILAYNSIGGFPAATSTSPGAAPLSLAAVRADITAARRAGADVVIVMPHWGVEYTDKRNSVQTTLAPALIDAGADLVLGGHSHWAGPVGMHDGRLIVYSMGNLVFDLIHDARTQQGVIVELTFRGSTLVEARLRPTAMVSVARLHLLESAFGGAALVRAIATGSAGLGLP